MKISFIGDSIRIQYAPVVEQMLGEGYEFFGPKENCRFAKYTLRGIFDWEKNMQGSRIVHWNNGLWDICDLFGDGLFTSESEYVENMLRIADILKSRYDVVIFATTTPVSPLNKYNRNDDIRRYNELIVPLLMERGIVINDLYSLVSANIDKYVSDDLIHLSDAGIELCAKRVAEIIECEAQKLSPADAPTLMGEDAIDLGAPVTYNGK